jgi:hypothetical protein
MKICPVGEPKDFQEKNLLSLKTEFDFVYSFRLKHFSLYEKCIKNVYWYSCKVSVFLYILMKIWMFWAKFQEKTLETKFNENLSGGGTERIPKKKNLLNLKTEFDFIYSFCLKHFSLLEKCIKNVYWSSCKVSVFFVYILMKIRMFWENFRGKKNIRNKI